MSTEWSNKGEKGTLVTGDKFMIIDSEDANLATKNKQSDANILLSAPFFYTPIDFDIAVNLEWNRAFLIKDLTTPRVEPFPAGATEGDTIVFYVDEIGNTDTLTLDAAAQGYTINNQATFVIDGSRTNQILAFVFDGTVVEGGTNNIDVKTLSSDITDLTPQKADYQNLNDANWENLDGNYFLTVTGTELQNEPVNFPKISLGTVNYFIFIVAKKADTGDVFQDIVISRVSSSFVPSDEIGRRFSRAGTFASVTGPNPWKEAGLEPTYSQVVAFTSPVVKQTGVGGRYNLRALAANIITLNGPVSLVPGGTIEFFITENASQISFVAAGGGVTGATLEGLATYDFPSSWLGQAVKIIAEPTGDNYKFAKIVDVFLTQAEFDVLPVPEQVNAQTRYNITDPAALVVTFGELLIESGLPFMLSVTPTIVDTMTAGLTSGPVVLDGANGKTTINETAIFRVFFDATGATNSNNKEITFEVFKNGAPLSPRILSKHFQSASGLNYPLFASKIISVVSGDFFDLRVSVDSVAGGPDYTPVEIDVSYEKIKS